LWRIKIKYWISTCVSNKRIDAWQMWIYFLYFILFNKHIWESLIALENIIMELSEVDHRSSWIGVWKERCPRNSSKCNHWGKLSCSHVIYRICPFFSVVCPGSVLPYLHLFFFTLSLFDSWMLSYYQSSRVHLGKCGWPVVTDVLFFFSNCHYNISFLFPGLLWRSSKDNCA
jgi:hypothetical protein